MAVAEEGPVSLWRYGEEGQRDHFCPDPDRSCAGIGSCAAELEGCSPELAAGGGASGVLGLAGWGVLRVRGNCYPGDL